MKETINKLNSFILKMVTLLEEEIDELSSKKTKSAVNVKKSLTETLNKLVNLMMQLNKLNKDDSTASTSEISSDDQNIIKRFLSRNNNDQ